MSQESHPIWAKMLTDSRGARNIIFVSVKQRSERREDERVRMKTLSNHDGETCILWERGNRTES